MNNLGDSNAKRSPRDNPRDASYTGPKRYTDWPARFGPERYITLPRPLSLERDVVPQPPKYEGRSKRGR
jgi:hypothetical protein